MKKLCLLLSFFSLVLWGKAEVAEVTPAVDMEAVVWRLEKAESLGFYFDEDEGVCEGSELTLYRDGVKVRTYGVSKNVVDDKIFVGAKVDDRYRGEGIRFEKGVKFDVELSLVGSDVYKWSFIGDSEEVDELELGSWDLWGNTPYHPIMFDYPTLYCILYDPITLLPDAKVQIYTGDGKTLIEESPIWIQKNGLLWLDICHWGLMANIDISKYSKDENYLVVVPAGCVVTDEGDIVVNSREEHMLNLTSSVEELDVATESGIKISQQENTVLLENLRGQNEISVFDMSGKKIYQTEATSNTLFIPFNEKGMFLISIDGETYRLLVK